MSSKKEFAINPWPRPPTLLLLDIGKMGKWGKSNVCKELGWSVCGKHVKIYLYVQDSVRDSDLGCGKKKENMSVRIIFMEHWKAFVNNHVYT